ncbi:MAG: DUF4837 family protein [Candidatus Neomarinimicrobiota bacterium]
MRLRKSITILVGLLLTGTACDYKPAVIGQENLLVIITSDEDRPLLEPLLEEVFLREIATPAPEPIFQLKWATPYEFEDYQHYKNLIVASLSNPVDSTGDLLARRILGVERVEQALTGGNPIYLATDYLAKGQIFLGITAHSSEHAQQELERLETWIFDQFEQQLRRRQYESVYKYKTEKKLGQQLEKDYGFSLRIQHGFIIIKEKPEQNFVWLGRGYPYRWVAIHWVEGGDSIQIDRVWAWEQMEYIADDLFAAIYLDSLFRTTELGMEKGHEIMIQRGVWAHKQQTAGGPFVNYIFRDRGQNRIYFLTGVVFNPGRSKVLLIKRIETMMRTFRSFDRPRSTSANSSIT